MDGFRIFIVEDDKIFAKRLQYELSLNSDLDLSTYTDGKSLLKALQEEPDLITLDYHLPDSQGDELLQIIKKELLNLFYTADEYIFLVSPYIKLNDVLELTTISQIRIKTF